jgi:hypothetical protein
VGPGGAKNVFEQGVGGRENVAGKENALLKAHLDRAFNRAHHHW